jgi:predicted nucleic acid-binding Zn ribbon protein
MNQENDYNQYKLNDLVTSMFKKYKLDDKIEELKLYSVWEEIMGKTIAGYTEGIKLKNGILTINLSSAALRNELLLAREKLVKRLNEAIGKELIKDIHLR